MIIVMMIMIIMMIRWWSGALSLQFGTTTGSGRLRISSAEPGTVDIALKIKKIDHFTFVLGSTLGPVGTLVGRLRGWTGPGRRFPSGSRCSTGQTSGWKDASASDPVWTLGPFSEVVGSPLLDAVLIIHPSRLHSVTRDPSSGCIICDMDINGLIQLLVIWICQ